MTADTAAPVLAAAVVRSPVEGIGAAASSATAEAAGKSADKTAPAAPADTVEISNWVQKPKQKPGDEETVRKEAYKRINRQTAAQREMGDILFIYNVKGDLRVRFMDSSNMLIYQTPPVMLSKMMDLMQSFGSFVNIKV